MFFIQFLLNLLIVKQSADFIQFEFEKYIDQFSKPYKNDPIEYFKRIKIFENSLRQIAYLNSMRIHKDSAYYGITKYSDLSPDEFRKIVLKNRRESFQKREKRNFIYKNGTIYNVPRKFDWRDKNVIGQVRNQGNCGACWAYSTVSTIESMVAIKTNKLIELSTQQLIDCSTKEGCLGGDTCSALKWLTKNNITVETEKNYPREEFSGDCKMTKMNSNGVKVRTDYLCNNFVNNEPQILNLIALHGPLIATVDASTWQNYLGGIIQYHCFNNRNHAVQITGYDLTGSIPFYKVKNTWDTNFGINGYIHIAFGNNLCGIAEEISAVNVLLN